MGSQQSWCCASVSCVLQLDVQGGDGISIVNKSVVKCIWYIYYIGYHLASGCYGHIALIEKVVEGEAWYHISWGCYKLITDSRWLIIDLKNGGLNFTKSSRHAMSTIMLTGIHLEL